ncbi:sigma-54-dependent transcriptional regulator [Inmirania thermothiophila]|uniref:Two-component response regulator PilR n=1 Tax=Inmirania thermothiophila TaxID=1750597 RepID=A0A3N1YBC2_9GAMM|nr:sigma-54 dependent transcriptional regulator [Inmirania thermothiophila]ROR34697.1 two-component response regulator PilR [Inmirania thermothiophila]
MSRARALVVDDEADIRELVAITLARMDVEARCAADLAEARALAGAEPFDLCLTDMRLPDGSGIDLVRHLQRTRPDLPAAVITAYGDVESAVEALKAGAFDFVSKPVDLGVLRRLVETALRLRERRAPGRLHLVGDSPPMRRLRAMIAKLARSQAPVYISGESGTGKELVARMIHEQGPRAAGPFVPVNCGAIPAELMESELFGHVKGAFTGAAADKEGLFQAAEGGTLFLDEIAELPPHMQVKLLRAIQEKAVRPVGAAREVPVDVRILSATHKDLAALVQAGEFRQDLYYRINVIELAVPPLRARREDIPALAEHFLARIAAAHGGEPPRLGAAALEALMRYPFPGNVRELENILERACTLCEGDEIRPEDLQLPEDGGSGAFEAPEAVPEEGLETYLDRIERETILKALEETRWNRTQAAKRLGISFRALRYRLKKLGLDG